jgi:hypothetical protein
MATTTFSELPVAIHVSGTEIIPADQYQGTPPSGTLTTVSITVNQIVLLTLAVAKGYPSSTSMCTNRQMREALAAGGNLVTIDSATSADINNATTIEWRNGNLIVLGDPVSVLVQTTLGYSNAQMAALFASAQTYPL